MTRSRAFFAAGLLLALVLASVVSFWASSAPDGLEKVASDEGFGAAAKGHHLAEAPLADYSTKGVENDWLSIAIAGASGVGLTLVLGGALFLALGRGRRNTVAPAN